MSHRLHIFVLIGALVMASVDAYAAQRPMRGAEMRTEIAEPADGLPDLPNDTRPPVETGQRSSLPVLPLSSPCKKPEVFGLWILNKVYEEPVGTETQSLIISPIQYIFFKPDGLFGRYNAASAPMRPRQILAAMKKHSTGLQQYLVQEGGKIFYYLDKVASDVQVCFIVLEDKESFTKGDLLLMPPKGQISGRLIKQYSRLKK
jgi:hypothetical protein